MFTGYSPETVDFLWGIRMNNNREWFLQHKQDYVKYLYEPTKALGKELFLPFVDKSGELLKRALRVQCPVTMIHGEYDPHPAAGSAGLLEGKLPGFRSYLLEKCGHDPWKETYAREEFTRIIKEELI